MLSLGLLFSLNSFSGDYLNATVSALDQHKLSLGASGYVYFVTCGDDSLRNKALKRAGAFALLSAQQSDLDLNKMAKAAGAAAAAEYMVEGLNQVPYAGQAVDTVLDKVSFGYLSDDAKRAVKVMAAQCIARSIIEQGSSKFKRSNS